MTKQAVNFRLSSENIQMITEFSKKLGMYKTELLEFILTLIRQNPDFFLKSFEKSWSEAANSLSPDSV